MSIKSSRKKSLGFIILIVVMGAFIGSAIGEIIGLVLPDGVVKQFFLASVEGVVGPTTINIVILSFTLGFTFKLNLIGVIGVVIAVYLLRWY